MLNIITLGDEQLRKHSIVVPELDGTVHTLIEQMFESMRAHKGIGLAAVQVGNLYRLFITEVAGDKPRVFVNPEILETSLEQVSYEEGCLSIPGIESEVIRPQRVRVQACAVPTRRGRLLLDRPREVPQDARLHAAPGCASHSLRLARRLGPPFSQALATWLALLRQLRGDPATIRAHAKGGDDRGLPWPDSGAAAHSPR